MLRNGKSCLIPILLTLKLDFAMKHFGSLDTINQMLDGQDNNSYQHSIKNFNNCILSPQPKVGDILFLVRIPSASATA